MPETIDQYQPQIAVAVLRKKAFFAWVIGLSVVSAWVLLIIAAPAADFFGFTAISAIIYKSFSFLCHQMPERSFHLFGDPFAVCSRCFGVYLGLVVGFLIYPLIKKIDDIEPFHRVWLFLSLIPIGIDWSLGVFGIWENNHLSRSITGAILGFACAVFIIPAIVELSQLLSRKRLTR